MSTMEEHYWPLAIFLEQGCTVSILAYTMTPVIKGVSEKGGKRKYPESPTAKEEVFT